jgi:hypothetical protein
MAQDPLKHMRIQFAAAETGLTRARANMRAEAEKLGLPTAGIFAESEFVSRTTAERWVSSAKRAAQAEAVEAMTMALAASNAASASSARSSGGRPIATADAIVAAGKKARGER